MSKLWQHIHTLKLKINMRILQLVGQAKEEMEAFEKFLLDIGNGEYPEIDGKIQLPQNICFMGDNLQNFLDSIYNNLDQLGEKITDRAILTPLNENVTRINNILLQKFPGTSIVYKSADSVVNDDAQARLFPTEFLNSINPSGMPEHILQLKGILFKYFHGLFYILIEI